jgi:lysophospholipase L1-like esterase
MLMLVMRSRLILALTLLAGVGTHSYAQCVPPQNWPTRAEPEPWEGEIAAFEAGDRLNPPAKGGILFVGGSSIRLWPDLKADFPGLNVVQRGFGGTDLNLVVYYFPRVVLPYCPRVIVLYAGENDLNDGYSPEAVADEYKKFVAIIHRSMPKTRIVFVSIKPSIARLALLKQIKATNELVRKYTATDPKLVYVDVFTPMLDAAGQPRGELLDPDKLHLNARGYALWRDLLTPIVVPTVTEAAR